MTLRLTECVASRICHDLISPIGAISNGVELLQLTQGGIEETNLVADSAKTASARVRFFRLAFGQSGPDQPVQNKEVECIFNDLNTERVSVDWKVSGALQRDEVQAVFLGLMCLEQALPKGGQVMVRRHGIRWQLSVTETNTRIDDGLWTALARLEIPGDFTPATVSFPLLIQSLKDQNKVLEIQITTTQISLSF
ncbi:MAG: histidine phosphotransferase family protein [Cognatishimia sp.]